MSAPELKSSALLHLAQAVRATGYHFTTPTPATHSRVIARSDRLAADLRDVFGWSRSFQRDTLPDDVFELAEAAGVLERSGTNWRSTLRLASLGPDLLFHSAYPTHASNAVFFGPDTYRFCAAIETALSDCPTVGRAVDLCSGAAPGAIAIAHKYPDAEIYAADINDDALQLGAVNALLAGARQVRAVHSNLLSAIDGTFDLVVANPPYLNDPGQRTYRHGGGSHGERLSLQILDAAMPRLRPGGRLVLYTGVAILNGVDPFLAAATTRLGSWAGSWRYRETDPDVFGEELDQPAYADADRIAAVVLSVTRD